MLKTAVISFAVNVVFLFAHIAVNCQSPMYFFQLTVLAQIITCFNFGLTLFLKEETAKPEVQSMLSQIHTTSIGLESVVVVGFWSLRIFLPQGIINVNEERTMVHEILSMWLHGGSFLNMLYYIQKGRLPLKGHFVDKLSVHLLWAVPFLGLQLLHYVLFDKHIYEFITEFDWIQLITFEMTLYIFSASFDYLVTIRNGFKSLEKQVNRPLLKSKSS